MSEYMCFVAHISRPDEAVATAIDFLHAAKSNTLLEIAASDPVLIVLYFTRSNPDMLSTAETLTFIIP